MRKATSFVFTVTLTLLASQAYARRITVAVPSSGAPTHDAGSAISRIERLSGTCSIAVTFAKRPKFLIASAVGEPYAGNSGEAPARLLAIAHPVRNGGRYEFGCLTPEQIFYKDGSGHTRSTTGLTDSPTGSAAGTTIYLDLDS